MLQTCCVGLLLSRNPVRYEPSSQPFSSKEVVQVDGLELVSGTYRMGQTGPWVEQSMGKDEVLGFLHRPERGDLPQTSSLGMQPVFHQAQI